MHDSVTRKIHIPTEEPQVTPGATASPMGSEEPTPQSPKAEQAGTVPRSENESGHDSEPTRRFQPLINDAGAPEDPVVGWLVVIQGPGQGAVYSLACGNNTLGREADNHIALSHGDTQISRHRQAVVSYDPVHRRHSIQPGEGPNLAYVDGEPVLGPVSLSGGETLAVGATRLRFVPLCDHRFDWQDVAPWAGAH